MNTFDEQLFNLYRQGLNDYEVAKIVHKSRSRLRQWREEHGIKSRTNKKGLPDDLCPSVYERLMAGETLTEIGKSLDVFRSSMTRLLKRNGYETGFRSRPDWTRDYKFTALQESVLFGEMFGDGGLVCKGHQTAYYQCGHGIAQKAFLDWKYEIFSPLSCRRVIYENKITMATWSSEVLYDYWRWFYPTGKGNKVIQPAMVSKLDWMGLTVWFMGDGTRDREQLRFSVGKDQDLNPVVTAMNEKFGGIFSAKLYSREWHLKIADNEKFYEGIKPYLLPYFSYKIPTALQFSKE